MISSWEKIHFLCQINRVSKQNSLNYIAVNNLEMVHVILLSICLSSITATSIRSGCVAWIYVQGKYKLAYSLEDALITNSIMNSLRLTIAQLWMGCNTLLL